MIVLAVIFFVIKYHEMMGFDGEEGWMFNV